MLSLNKRIGNDMPHKQEVGIAILLSGKTSR